MRKRRPIKLDFSTRGGHRLLLDDTTGHVELRHASGPVVAIEPSGSISINANSRIELTATEVKITAATVSINAALTTTDGMIQCDTLVARVGVVSPSYTPGTGN
jgi:hypothetical protein